MDFERIKLLLDVWHDTLNVPDLKVINAEAMDELKEWNNGTAIHSDDEPEFNLEPGAPEPENGARRI